MAYIIGTMLALLSLIVISYPFLKSRLQSQAISRPDELEELARARQSLFDEMDRLKLDLDVDNITQEEYEERIAGVRRAAATSLRDEELLRGPGKVKVPPYGMDRKIAGGFSIGTFRHFFYMAVEPQRDRLWAVARLGGTPRSGVPGLAASLHRLAHLLRLHRGGGVQSGDHPWQLTPEPPLDGQ